jgi:hypothetical protein
MSSLRSASVPRRGRVAVAAAALVVLGAITAGSSSAQVAAASNNTSSSPTPVFVLDRGGFTAFDGPDEGAQETVGINNRGEIVGGYLDSTSGCVRGFLRDKRGRLTLFGVPGAGVTQPVHINDRGQTVGNYRTTDD